MRRRDDECDGQRRHRGDDRPEDGHELEEPGDDPERDGRGAAGNPVEGFDAVAGGPDAGHRGAHPLVGDDASGRTDGQPGPAGKLAVRPHSQTEHDELFASIRSGNAINNGHYMCNSTLIEIMGRMCTYTGQDLTWEQANSSQERQGPSEYAWGDIPEPPVPIPGVTKFA